MPSPRNMLKGFGAVIVTGGSSGIGKSFIEVGVKLAPHLVFCNLSRSAPDIHSPELKLRHFPCDLSNSQKISETTNEVISYLRPLAGKLKILLINNSGFGSYGVFSQAEVAGQIAMIDLNVRALVELTGRFLPFLEEQGGAVINVASTASFQPTPYMATYGATKAFVLHWSLALGEELKAKGVQVLALCPGPTSTQFFQRAGMKTPMVSDALGETSEKVVLAGYDALASGSAMVVSGWKNKIMAGLGSKIPKVWAAQISAKVIGHFRIGQK